MSNRIEEIAFAIITYFPKWYSGKLRSFKHTDKIRGDLAIEFAKKATASGYRVVVSDGKSTKTFIKKIKIINGVIFKSRKTANRSAGRRQAILAATKLPGVKAILLTEAEKITLLDYINILVEPIIENTADIVIPKRNDDLFQKTYPSYMYKSEKEGNILYNEILRTNNLLKDREDYDLFFGPRVIANKPEIIRLFLKKYKLKISKNPALNSYFNYEDYSSTQFFPIVMGLIKKYRIKSVTVNFSYSETQKINEEKGEKSHFEEKRIFQRMSILIELLYFLNHLRGRKLSNV